MRLGITPSINLGAQNLTAKSGRCNDIHSSGGCDYWGSNNPSCILASFPRNFVSEQVGLSLVRCGFIPILGIFINHHF